MGIYFNPGNYSFKNTLNGKIYVDKSMLIEYTNNVLFTPQQYLCISRPRRFGKSTDAHMMIAYYSKGCNSNELFEPLKISKSSKYHQNLNKYNVIYLNMQDFLSFSNNVEDMVGNISTKVVKEIKKEYLNIEETNLIDCLYEIFTSYNETFVFVIDEWDCVLRNLTDLEEQKRYLDYLRVLLKDKPYVALVYMTGILPIKKYGTHSALNMFDEVSMIEPLSLSHFMGFTEQEVNSLCIEHNVDFNEMKTWYDGYQVKNDISVYNPKSVITSLLNHSFGNYWTQTETYEALKRYINQNLDGLKDTIISLLSGEKEDVNTSRFVNDMTTLHTKDDVLTLLIHLGYLGYDQQSKKVYIPNKEVRDSFIAAINDEKYKDVNLIVENSQSLLEATWNFDERKVESIIERAHMETSILQYNDENALAYTINLAYIAARNHYTLVRELPTEKGFADIVFIPYKDKPAMIIELKWNKDTDSAINQIKNKQYMFGLNKYLDNLILVGINYDSKTKKHSCKIEKY